MPQLNDNWYQRLFTSLTKKTRKEPIVMKKDLPFELEVAKPTEKRRQYELSDADVEFLGENQYSDEAWLRIARKHLFDPDTREYTIAGTKRAFTAIPKKDWPPYVEKGGVLTSNGMQAGKGVAPIPHEMMREVLANRDLTKPTSDETHTEEIEI